MFTLHIFSMKYYLHSILFIDVIITIIMHAIAYFSAGLLEQPTVLEAGQKREKKKVERLELTSEKKERRLSLEQGTGTKLGDIARVEFQLQRTHAEDLKPLHKLLFDRTATVSS